MTSEPSPTARLKKLLKRAPNERLIRGLLRVLESRHVGSDYPVALMGAAIIERALEAAILTRFVTLTPDQHKRLFRFENRGPLRDAEARIQVAAALGLFGPTTERDLQIIRNVRNAFAHWPSLFGFDQDEVVHACAHLKIIKGPATAELAIARNTPKGRYISACLEISARLRKTVELSSPVTKGSADLP
jgi:hypothetical protein